MSAKKPKSAAETLRRVSLGLAVGLFCASQLGAETSPGLSTAITEARIGADRRPVATIKVTDGKGNALELADLDAGSIAFTIAAVNATKTGETHYQNYILHRVAGQDFTYKAVPTKPALAETLQPDVDRGGALKQVRPGVFTYTSRPRCLSISIGMPRTLLAES